MNRKKPYYAVLAVIALMLYLNIGWVFATYFAEHILPHEPETLWQTFWAGGFGIFAGGNPHPYNNMIGFYAIATTWPLIVLMILGSWIVEAGYFLFLLIFGGGLAKLIGLA